MPGATNWLFASVRTPDGQTLHVVVFETSAGNVGVGMTGEDLRRFGQQCVQAATGIEVARADQLPGNGSR